jgi:hypothetical protein
MPDEAFGVNAAIYLKYQAVMRIFHAMSGGIFGKTLISAKLQ